MNAETRLEAVREIAENAYRRPAPLQLRLAKPEELKPALPRAIIPYEELHPSRIGGEAGRASGQRSRKPRREPVTLVAMQKDFMAAAVEKTLPEAA